MMEKRRKQTFPRRGYTARLWAGEGCSVIRTLRVGATWAVPVHYGSGYNEHGDTLACWRGGGGNGVLVRRGRQQGLAPRALCVVAGPCLVLASRRCFRPLPDGNEVWCLFLCSAATGTSSFVKYLPSIFLLGHLSLCVGLLFCLFLINTEWVLIFSHSIHVLAF